MKRSNRLIILVGVLLAVLAFVGVLFVLNQGGGGPSEPAEVLTKVLVAKRDIALGDEVTPDMVEVSEVTPEAVEGTPFSDPSQLTGRPAIQDIPSGAQVTKELVGQAVGAVCISCQLEPGEKAIAFQVDRVTGIDFLILPGDHIDVVVSQGVSLLQPTQDTIDNPAGEQRFEVVAGTEGARTVKTVLQDKRVLYVSQARNLPGQSTATPAPDGGDQQQVEPIVSVIVVIAGTDQDAELIKFAQDNVETVGPLTAVLRNPQDDVAESTTGLTLALLIDRYGVPVPDIVLLPLE